MLLVRHGQASFGARDYDKLSAIGEQQSQLLGQWLKRIGQMPDLIVTGSMQRHRRTAELCIEAAGVDAPSLMLDSLDELDHEEILARARPDLTSHQSLHDELSAREDPQRAFQRLFAGAIDRWTDGAFDHEYRLSWPGFRQRVLDGLQVLASHDARTIWVFTSGGPIAVIVNQLLAAPPENTFPLSWPLVNTSLTRVSLTAGRSRLISYNGWPHLELAADRHLVTHR